MHMHALLDKQKSTGSFPFIIYDMMEWRPKKTNKPSIANTSVSPNLTAVVLWPFTWPTAVVSQRYYTAICIANSELRTK